MTMGIKVGLKYIEKWHSDLESQVQRYEQEAAEKGQIVFYGPSNFTRWGPKYGNPTLKEEILGKSGKQCCINRGFGSSCTEHHLYYYSRMVKPLEPKVLVYAPGLGNGTAFGYTPQEMFELAQRVVLYAKSDFPDLKIYLCGLNLYRDKRETSAEYDGWLRAFAAEVPDCTYVDVAGYEPLHRTDILAEDNKHFNHEGYKIYGELFKEVLKEELEQY